jgi:hypothetical protein
VVGRACEHTSLRFGLALSTQKVPRHRAGSILLCINLSSCHCIFDVSLSGSNKNKLRMYKLLTPVHSSGQKIMGVMLALSQMCLALA